MAEDGLHGFIESKSCLTNPGLIACSDRTAGVVDERRAVIVTYLDFRKAFNATSLNTPDQARMLWSRRTELF